MEKTELMEKLKKAAEAKRAEQQAKAKAFMEKMKEMARAHAEKEGEDHVDPE